MRWMEAESSPKAIVEQPISATGQYLKPLLERAVHPELVEGRSSPAKSRPVSKGRKRKPAPSGDEGAASEDELNLAAAK